MINIRYHIVSITAVFLALGIGVALGSTFLDRATVDLLENRIGSAEDRIDDTNAENERLTSELADADERDASLIVLASEDLVSDHLTDVPLLVIAAPGVSEDGLDALSTVLERTGADLAGTVRLDDKLALDEVDGDLAEDLGLSDPTGPELRRVVDDALTEALAAAGAPAEEEAVGPDADPQPSDGPDGTQPAIISTLADRGFLDVVPGPARAEDDPILERTGYRYVLVGAPDLDAAQNDVLLSLIDDEDVTLPAVTISARVPEPADGGDEPAPGAVARIREDGDLSTRYSTVDDADTFTGLLSTIYVLQQIDAIDVGHYGQGDGATAILPPVP
ncbi:MAG: copper transporter [Acidimicrobiales bacterium]|nr:copper transporter [Acidimicrobiales bacterium]